MTTLKTSLMTGTAAAMGFALIGGAAAAQNAIDTSNVMFNGSEVTFDSVMIEQDGYIVIHTILDGQVVAPESIGHTALTSGANTDVTVTTEYDLVEGENYVAMLHVESNDNGTYDFGIGNTDVDTPVMADGAAVTAQFNGSSQEASTQTDGQDASAMDMQSSGDQQPDAVVATVGDAEIRGSDVMTAIGMLPPQLQSQPPQMLLPMALDQLIVRELILEDARAQNLAEDPEVVAIVDSSSQTATDDAMVQVWLKRELANVVTDEAVQSVYTEAQAAGQQGLPAIEEVRPQIEQYLLQQAMQGVQLQLREGADIIFYDPTGRPMAPQQD